LGLDRVMLRLGVTCLALAVPIGGCGDGSVPRMLVDGAPARAGPPWLAHSVVGRVRVVRAGDLGRAFVRCGRLGDRRVERNALVVERVAVSGRSLTFTTPNGHALVAYQTAGVASERRLAPWCTRSFGLLQRGRLVDSRLDIGCRDRRRRVVAFAWVEPLPRARWIAVDQGAYAELFEVADGMPVRVSSTRGVDLGTSRARFDIAQYTASGRRIARQRLVARVAG
jgi:hypothetical protein